MPGAIREIQGVFKKHLPEFDHVKAEYESLAIEAKGLSGETRVFAHNMEVDQASYRWLGEASIVISIGSAAAGSAAVAATVTLTPLAVAYLAAAGVSIVAGGAGGAYVNYNQYQFTEEIIQSATLISDVMMQIDKLMHKQSKILIEIRKSNEDVLQHTDTIEQVVNGMESGTCVAKKNLKKRVPRLLALLEQTASQLVVQCRAYRNTDLDAQQKVWEALQQHADHTKQVAKDQNNVLASA